MAQEFFKPLTGYIDSHSQELRNATAHLKRNGHQPEPYYPADGSAPWAICRWCPASWTLGHVLSADMYVLTWMRTKGEGTCPYEPTQGE